MSLYGTGIRCNLTNKWFKKKYLFGFEKIVTILLASLMFMFEEVQNIFVYYKESKVIQSLRKKYDSYEKLSPENKKDVRLFFDSKIRQLDGAQKLICREASIQVILQLTLIAYQENFEKL